ncbi:RNA pseudouridylate synthase domain-containing protein 3-like [Acanthaster planci]|uniref:RNA pseudouridylate synthase domain-containing protein 3-like n=1 Tax=Acanthaster planci TaxID=133434 RepID=A0A8B7ZGF3_ACAPL|nr:RNA pseudouridylate synthase domain-containing protein 3-like [Acanthaster planci]
MKALKRFSQLEFRVLFSAPTLPPPASSSACKLQCTVAMDHLEEGEVPNHAARDFRATPKRKRRRRKADDQSIFAECGFPWSEKTTVDELEKHISNSKVYDKDGIIALNKPAGIPVTAGSQDNLVSVVEILPKLVEAIGKPAAEIAKAAKKESSGLLLLGEDKQTANALSDAFLMARRRNQLIRKYWALTVGIPSPVQGTINLPIGAEKIGDQTLMVPKRDASKGSFERKEVFPCRTEYRVLSANHDLNCCLLELQPLKLQNQQFQVHLSNKLCSILGDRLYSNQIRDILGVPVLVDPHRAAIGTQNIPEGVQKVLGLRAQHMSRLPLFLHWYQVTLPKWRQKRDVSIQATPPGYFMEAVKRLGLSAGACGTL